MKLGLPTREKTPASPAETQARIHQLHRAEMELSARVEELQRAIERAASDAGDSMLAAHLDPTGAQRPPEPNLTALRADLDSVTAAIISARAQRRAAILELWRGQAHELRQRARALKDEAAERAKRTDELLRQLAEFEGVSYVPAGPAPQSRAHSSDAPPALTISYVAVPRTQLLIEQAANLEMQARRIEAQTPIDSGELRASNSAELVSLVEAFDALKFTPSIPDLRAWLRPVELAQLVLVLDWRNGAIDETRSRAFVPQLER
jgi:hypothetical protein